MSAVARARHVLRNLFRRGRVERALDAEIRGYLDLLTDEKIAAGLSPDAARRAARVELGGTEQVREQVRDARAGARLMHLVQDLRYAGRMMRRSPGFTFVALATLALGIGANTAMFSVVDAVLLRPLPYRAADRLASIAGIGYVGELVEFRSTAKTFDVAAYSPERPATVTGRGEPERFGLSTISTDLAALLGIDPVAGRTFAADDELKGAAPVVMVSEAFWRTHFGASPSAIGATLRIDGLNRTIVGVMPRAFQFPSDATALWVPMTVDRANRVALWSTGVRLVARTRPGYALDAVASELKSAAPAMRDKFPWNMPADYGQAVTAVPLREALVGDVSALLLILFASVAVVLLIASVNVSNLFVARAVGRQRELAIRSAIGAGRSRIVRQVLAEGAAFGIAGGACGLALAWFLLRGLVAALPPEMPRASEVALDARVLVFTAISAIVCGILVALAPAVAASRPVVASALGGGARTGTSRGATRTSRGLVAIQLALAVPLVISAILLARSFANLIRVSPGFDASALVTAQVSPPAFRFRAPASLDAFYRSLGDRLAALPAVEAVALADRAPFGREAYGSVFIIAGRPDPAREGGDWPLADVRASIGDSYFATLRLPLVEGRSFSQSDAATAPPVVIVSRALASKYWPGESPVGRQVKFPADTVWRTIVGISTDVKWTGVAEAVHTALYVPLSQSPPASATILLRTSSDSTSTAAQVRTVVATLDPDTPVDAVATMEERIGETLWRARASMLCIGAFALLGLSLGALGVYGAMSDLVARRRREIAVRIALGAGLARVIREVLVQAMIPAVAGLAVGLAIAAFATRTLSAFLFGVEPSDPIAFLVVPAILAAVALGACLVPARRAARIDPLAALRAD